MTSNRPDAIRASGPACAGDDLLGMEIDFWAELGDSV
jgi:hypothetical protein